MANRAASTTANRRSLNPFLSSPSLSLSLSSPLPCKCQPLSMPVPASLYLSQPLSICVLLALYSEHRVQPYRYGRWRHGVRPAGDGAGIAGGGPARARRCCDRVLTSGLGWRRAGSQRARARGWSAAVRRWASALLRDTGNVSYGGCTRVGRARRGSGTVPRGRAGRRGARPRCAY